MEVWKSSLQYEINLSRTAKDNPKQFYAYVNDRKPIFNSISLTKNENEQ